MTSAPTVLFVYEEWADRDVPLPSYESDGAAGADIRANLPRDQRADGFTLAAGGRSVVPTGLRVEIPQGFEVQVRPRSGLALKHGISLPNTPVTIDSDYRGPFVILLILVLNAMVAIYQDYDAEGALDALKNMQAAMCQCYRDGKWQTMDAT